MVKSPGECENGPGSGCGSQTCESARAKVARRVALRIGRLYRLGIHSAVFSRRLRCFAVGCLMPSDFLVGAVPRRADFGPQTMVARLASVSQPAQHPVAINRGSFDRH